MKPKAQGEHNDSNPNERRHARACSISLRRGLFALALSALIACASDAPREAIPIPATGDLRAAAALLMAQVETDEGAPDWAHGRRVEGEYVRGVGIEIGGRSAEHALYVAMRKARDSVESWLAEQGARAASPRDLHEPLAVVREEIEFERLAHDPLADRWYALARFDLGAARTALLERIKDMNGRLRASRLRVQDDAIESDERIRAALALLFELDHRGQLERAFRAYRGGALAMPGGLETTVLQEVADDFLSQHGVRILTQGFEVPGLESSIETALSEVHLQPDAFGRGLVSVRIEENRAFSESYPYLEVDGWVDVAIEGGDARTYSTPFHVVSSGTDIEEARFRAARNIHAEVARILRATLRVMATTEG